MSSQAALLVELIVSATTPKRRADWIWLRISAKSGEMMRVTPWPRSRSIFALMK